MNMNNAERQLQRLFDFQCFQINPRLEHMILDVEQRYCSAISDDDLEYVNAAGDPMPSVGEETDL